MSEVKLELAKKIMRILKLDEAGKIETFLNKEIKTFNQNIKDLKYNDVAFKSEYEKALNKIESDIEDAEEEVNNSYTDIRMENVTNNATMAAFSKVYWGNIDSAEKVLENLKKRKVELKENFDKQIKDNDEQIAKYQARIDKISSEK